MSLLQISVNSFELDMFIARKRRDPQFLYSAVDILWRLFILRVRQAPSWTSFYYMIIIIM